MTAATMQQTPAIPPRPARNQDKGDSLPKIPPRPAGKRPTDRSISPNPDRFAPSPLNAGIPVKSPKALRFDGPDARSEEPIDRPGSVVMPSLGEEGREYNVVAEEYKDEQEEPRAASPEQTSTVADDLKLHAPKPSLPAQSAKQRVQAVTRTDSDKAASFGIGRPASRSSIKKKTSTTFSGSDGQPDIEDEQGIPEIGQRVPMNPHLGDVQAPSPAPGSEEYKNHHRKHSSRGGPPGSYGLHGHGVAPQDKLAKDYYEKNPHVFNRENKTPLHERQVDYAMSSNDLNKLVRETASRASVQKNPENQSIPSEEVGFQASEEYASRISSPHLTGDDKVKALSFKSEITGPDGEKTVHVDEPQRPEYRSPGDTEHAVDDEGHEYTAPILASDEVGKDTSPRVQRPAVHPPPERSGSSNEMEEPAAKPRSRPTSLYRENNSQEFSPTPLDDVKEYEPLFDDDAKKEAQKPAESKKARHQFPSKDVWEDAPDSVHYTVEVSTPDETEKHRTLSAGVADRPITPAHLFAQRQEELAEREVQGPADVKKPSHQEKKEEEKPIWTQSQPESESFLTQKRPPPSQRFPSRDIWEDVPESQLHETTVSSSPQEETESTPEVPVRPAKKPSDVSEKPAIPERPKPRQTPPVDESLKAKPPVSEKPKPQIPARPSKDGEGAKAKPPVPNRPMGGKIAALQAGFMSDLNKRLQLGPMAPKKEEPKPQEDLTEEKEKAPLSDARKGRARGPQRRAPAKSPAAAAEPAKPSAPTLSFSVTQTFWSLDPEDGSLAVAGEETTEPAVQEEKEEEKVEETEKPAEASTPKEPVEESKTEAPEESKAEPPEEAPEESKAEAPEESKAEAPEVSKTETPEESKPVEEKTAAPDKEDKAPETETEAVVEPVVASEPVQS